MPTWPTELPQKQFIGLSEHRLSARLRSTVEVGEAIQRRRFSASTRLMTVPIVLTGTERAVFESFWEIDLGFGILTFDWEDPLSDVIVSFRFVDEPEWTLVTGGTEVPEEIPSWELRNWASLLNVEIMP